MEHTNILTSANPKNTLFTPKKAVSYLRVSTRGQAERGGGADEGFSIPAQREANKRKASGMGAVVIKEFVDRGASAKSADREDLQNMLTYIKENDIDYVIVHKVDRLARNREDDIEIMRVLRERGVKLVSTSEAIDDSPSGMLLHGIMSSIAEFYSQNLASEVIKGMSQKVKNGGTVSRAPLGYRNVRSIDEKSREERTIKLDEERAYLVKLAFELYASGEWTAQSLAKYLADRGLTTRPTPQIPARPVDKSTINKMLNNPYYKGMVRFNGKYHQGKHDPLVSEEVWEKVQDIISSHVNGERTREHPHFLKSTVFCGNCGSRLIIQYARSGSGLHYPYFSCAGRHRKINDCKQKSVLIEDVERSVERIYDNISLKPEVRKELEAWITSEIDKSAKDFEVERRELELEKDKLERRQKKLLETYYAEAIPLDLFKAEQDTLKAALGSIDNRISAHTTHYEGIKVKLGQALDLIEDCGTLYRIAPEHIRRAFNQALFSKVLIGGNCEATPEYSAPYNLLFGTCHEKSINDDSPVTKNRAMRLIDLFHEKQNTDQSHFFGQCFIKSSLVDPKRLELSTSALRTRRSPS